MHSQCNFAINRAQSVYNCNGFPLRKSKVVHKKGFFNFTEDTDLNYQEIIGSEILVTRKFNSFSPILKMYVTLLRISFHVSIPESFIIKNILIVIFLNYSYCSINYIIVKWILISMICEMYVFLSNWLSYVKNYSYFFQWSKHIWMDIERNIQFSIENKTKKKKIQNEHKMLISFCRLDGSRTKRFKNTRPDRIANNIYEKWGYIASATIKKKYSFLVLSCWMAYVREKWWGWYIFFHNISESIGGVYSFASHQWFHICRQTNQMAKEREKKKM